MQNGASMDCSSRNALECVYVGSEFSLLIAVLALEQEIIGNQASYLIQVATLLTFMVSSYVIVMRYPTPIAISDKLRRD